MFHGCITIFSFPGRTYFSMRVRQLRRLERCADRALEVDVLDERDRSVRVAKGQTFLRDPLELDSTRAL